MNVIDVYDIANSQWYKQSTTGTTPKIRVNPCAVVAAAPDASSFQIYLYGGQNLQPYDAQTQYDDMWILTIPSFTWIEVDLTDQSNPPARAGHTCNIWNGQMIVVGGYVGTEISCDSPGIYVFNASSLSWVSSYTALPGADTLNKQSTQKDGSEPGSGLSGSYGYTVPEAVQSVIGGSALGGATATTPAAGAASSGPIATGKPPTFTITGSGTTVVQTAGSTVTASSSPEAASSAPAETKKSSDVPAIAVGAVAGVLLLLAGYMGFCTWLYRRQLQMYRNHVAMTQQSTRWSSGTTGGNEKLLSGKREAVLGAFGTSLYNQGSGSPSREESSASSPTGDVRDMRFGVIAEEGHWLSSHYGHDSIEYPGAGPEMMGTGGVGYNGYLRAEGESREGSTNGQEDLLGGLEPSFFSVVMSPRRTLRVINKD